MSIRSLSVALCLTSLIVAGGCKHDDDTKKTSTAMNTAGVKTLYDRLGGEKAVTAVVDDFVGRAASDPKVNFTRKGLPTEWDPSPANVAKLKKHLVQFISMATGGPKTYEGKAMKPVHAGMKITEAEWGAIAGDLVASLKAKGVQQPEIDDLMKVVGTTHDDIVEVK